MSLFHHHHDDAHVDSPDDVFTVETVDGTLEDYRRDDFDQIFETRDQDEMERQVDIGWLVLDERVERHEIEPDIDDEFPAVSGVHLGGGTSLFTGGEEITVWTVGYLKEGAEGVAHED